jgi:putative ABC transport system substrate-binding protein
MRRRSLVATGIAAAGLPRTLWAQRRDGLRTVGILMSTTEDDAEGTRRIEAFLRSFAALGWKNGQNVRVVSKWSGGDASRTEQMARELVALEPDVIVSQNTLAAKILLAATRSVPVVFTQVTEPVAAGFVQSVARPGGNATGFTSFEPEMGSKWLEFLKEIAPRTKRAGFLFNPEASEVPAGNFLRMASGVASAMGIGVRPFPFHDAADLERALLDLGAEPDSGLIVVPDASTNAHRAAILTTAERQRLPSIFGFPFFVRAGGLLSYGPDPLEQFDKAAQYVDRILKGESPASLPVQRPGKFELTINARTARVLGLSIPPHILASADEVID